MNKYLTKSAELQEAIRDVLSEHRNRKNEIEQPIQDMYAGFDDLEQRYAVDNSGVTIARSLGVPEWHKFQVENSMRKALKTDEQHEANSISTADRILSLGGVKPPTEISVGAAKSIIHNFKRITPESNGQIGLRNLGTAGSTVLGAIGGGFAANRYAPGMAIGGALGGAIAGGIIGHVGLSKIMKPAIEARDQEIHEDLEQRFKNAYNRLRQSYGQ